VVVLNIAHAHQTQIKSYFVYAKAVFHIHCGMFQKVSNGHLYKNVVMPKAM